MSEKQRVACVNAVTLSNAVELIASIVDEVAGGDVARTLGGAPIKASILAETASAQIQARLARYQENPHA